MEKKETINDRISLLVNTFAGGKNTIFAKKIGTNEANIRNYSKNIAPRADILEKIVNIYDINSHWLLTGEGKMIANNNSEENYSISTNKKLEPYQTKNKEIGIPYYDVDFIAGFDLIFNDQTTIPTTNIVLAPFANATLWCNVSGESMSPKICNGDIIALKEQEIRDILYGEIYAIIMDNLRTVKILRKGSSPNKIKLVPINSGFDEQEFDIIRIKKVYAVLGTIKKFF